MTLSNFLWVVLYYVAALVVLMFPYFYISFKRGSNKYLFLSACTGSLVTIFALLYAFSLPFTLMLTKVIPQLAEYNLVENILPFLHFIDFVQQYHLIVLLPILVVLLPALIYRRYSIFKKKI